MGSRAGAQIRWCEAGFLSILKEWIEPLRPAWIDELVRTKIASETSWPGTATGDTPFVVQSSEPTLGIRNSSVEGYPQIGGR